MKLTKTERLMLANQYEILAELTDDDSYKEAYNRNQVILRDAYEGEYHHLVGYMADEVMSKEWCAKIHKILFMHSNIKYANPDYVFPGFDGNNEGDEYAYTDFLITNQCYTRLKSEQGYNSHRPMLERYERMLEVHDGLSPQECKLLSKENIDKILQAGEKA